MNKPYVSIILPVHNGEKTLPLCLDSLMSLDYPKEKLEIIVVDNNSIDTTRDIIGRYRVKYLFEPKKGAPVALNRGIQNSQGEIIAFTHSDCFIEKGWIKNMVRGFSENNVGGCGGKALGWNAKSQVEKYCDYRRLFFQNGNVAQGRSLLPWIDIVNGAFRRDVLYEVELFDEFFTTSEYEIDLSWKIYLKGYKLKYAPNAIVYHKYRDTLAGLWKRYFKIAYYSPRFARKYKKIYESLYIVPYKNFPYIFLQSFCALGQFLKGIFIKKDKLEITFPLLDIVVYSAFFWGSLYGFFILKMQRENAKFQSLEPYNKIIYRNLNNKTVILNPKRGGYYNLEGISKRAWQLFSEKRQLNEIVDIISGEYKENKEKIRNDLIGFSDELKEAGLFGTEKIEDQAY